MKLPAFSISQNTSFLTIASVIQKIISAIYFFFVSWAIGAAQTANYFNIFAAIAIFTVVADFGLNNIVTRDVAQTPTTASQTLSNALIGKFFFGALALVLLGLSKELLRYPSASWSLIAVAGLTLWIDSVRGLLYSYLRAHNNLRYEALGLIVSQIAVAVLGCLMVIARAPLIALVGVFTVVSSGHTIYALWCVLRKAGGKISLSFDKQVGVAMLKRALPFALAGIIAQIYSYQDAFLIHRYLSPDEGGDWARAYKVVYAFQFIPVALSASIYPVMSAFAGKEPERVRHVIERAYEYLLLVSLPIMTGISLVAGPLFAHYLPKFLPSVPVLEVLVWSLGFGFLWFVHGAVLNAHHRQSYQTLYVTLACVFSSILNIYLVPRFGIRGAAATAVMSNALLWALGYLTTSRVIGLRHRVLFTQTLKISLAALLMAFILGGAIRSGLPALLLVPLGGVSYIGASILLGAVSKDLLRSLVKKFVPSLSFLIERL